MLRNFENKLNDIAKINGFSKYTVTLKSGSEKGDNYVGDVYKVEIQENNTSKTNMLRLFIKSCPKFNLHTFTDMNDFFTNEIFVYTEIVPLLTKIQDEILMSPKDKYKFAQCYWFNQDDDNIFIIMEDLEIKGYNMHRPRTECLDFQHLNIVLKEIAKLHSLSFVLQQKEPLKFKAYKEKIEEATAKLNQKFPPEIFEKSLNFAIKTVKPEFRHKLKNLGSLVLKNLSSTVVPYGVLCHGDLHKNNMLFKYTKESTPEDVFILDYQVMRYASPVYDIIYVLFSSCRQVVRKNKLHELLGIYHQALTENLKRYSISVESIFPYAALKAEVQRLGHYGIAIAPMILPVLFCSKDKVTDFMTMINNIDEFEKQESSFKRFKEQLNEAVEDAIFFKFV